MTAHAPTISRPTAEPNITPFLDVLLVLLITFMSISIQMHHTLDAQLPVPCHDSCPAGSSIVLEVRSGPEFRVNRSVVAQSELAAHLTAIYRDRPEKVIQVAGYPDVRYQDVISAMDVARSAGVRVISIAPKESYLSR